MNYIRAAAARDQATRMIEALNRLRPGATDRLADSALAEISTWAGFDVREISENESAAGCSVAGAYLPGPPPVVGVVSSRSHARRDFTGLHELGHHLQRTQIDLIDVLEEQPDQGLELEDAACDAFAAEILLPDTLAAAHLGTAGPTAAQICDLWRASSASRMAACVKAAQHLPAPGHILLLDTDGQLVFAASRGLPRPRRGSDQSTAAVLDRALANGHHRTEGRTRLRYRDGIRGDELYVQTTDMGGYIVAVLVTDQAPWKTFSPPAPDQGPQAPWRACGYCDHDFRSFETACSTCRAPKCPECGQCDCPPRVAARTCPGCNLLQPPAMFDPPAATHCRDCS
ncbi:ImmA/IrrE family metallo-endopeptidase [Kitasatospora mediocidica]|uniref:ImmA/IrrE family metallo-endopeptidase n=1 Tax=Kitasatospora mediocidica TaxID=58352 RepID=UPI00056AAB46|nr:ImmA/IrrE family metallo-endopeptidase [Kitasatospora mediocidica]